MKIIVGLGNPGLQYARTRHNVGFCVTELLAEHLGISFSRRAFQSVTAEGRQAGEKVLLLQPQTFMNASGQAVLEAVQFYKVDWSDVLVIHDDLDLQPGFVRARGKGSAGGHRGLGDIIRLAGTNQISRLKIGVGHPLLGQVVDYVLQPFTSEEQPIMLEAFQRAAEAAIFWLEHDIVATMNRFNGLPGCGEKECPVDSADETK